MNNRTVILFSVTQSNNNMFTTKISCKPLTENDVAKVFKLVTSPHKDIKLNYYIKKS